MHAGARAMRDTERRAKGVFNHRTERIEWYECGMDTSQAKRVEHHPKGMRGWKDDKCMYEPMKPPARQALGRIFDPICVFKQKEFRLSSPASLDFKEIKETATYMVPKDTSEIVTPAKVPEFLQVRVPSIMERSLGAKRPPQDDAEYAEYADKKCTLADAATKVIPDSFSHDFVADRAALLALLEWGSGTLTPMLRKEGQQNNPIDIVKISKTDGGKALVLDCLYDKMNLYAEQPQKRSKFNPAERPLGGFKDALHLYVTGDQTKNWNIKGYSQHVKDHNLPKCYKFLDVPIDGLKLTVRAPKTHVHKGRRYLDEEVPAGYEDKSVELKYGNRYNPGSTTLLTTYLKMLLGKVDIFSFSLQGNGFFKTTSEYSIEDLEAKQPKVKEVAEAHLGRLTNLLKQVSEKIAADGGEGPWALQWRKGALSLGKYELAAVLEMKSEDLDEEMIIMA